MTDEVNQFESINRAEKIINEISNRSDPYLGDPASLSVIALSLYSIAKTLQDIEDHLGTLALK